MNDIERVVNNLLKEIAPVNSTGPAISGLTPETIFAKIRKRRKKKKVSRR